MGTQDTFTQAESFVAMTGIGSFPVVWSQSFDPAIQLGVISHPAWALLSPSGELVRQGVGGVAADELLEMAASI